MEYIHAIGQWIYIQNWFMLSFTIVGVLNCIVAASRVMGWNQLAEFCGKLEDAIQAIVLAWINRKQSLAPKPEPVIEEKKS